MTRSSLSLPARHFLRQAIASILQLDILLVLCRDETRWWNAEQIARELGASMEHVSTALEELAGRNLLDVRIGGTLAYRFAPVDATAAALLTEIGSNVYGARELVASGMRVSAAQRFADAFRLRRTDG